MDRAVRRCAWVMTLTFLATTLVAQDGAGTGSGASQASNAASTAARTQSAGGLEPVLNRMDRAAANFKGAQADFTWDTFQKVVSVTDTQKGVIYFRRDKKGLRMMAHITEDDASPMNKYVLYTGDEVRMYEPKIEQVTQYNTASHRADFETFLVLGFGGRGHDLEKSFAVRYLGKETAGNISADKLELVPKSQKARDIFEKIYLWIDPALGVSVRQQFMQPDGNYRDAHYANIKLNPKLSDEVFKLKTTSKTKIVSPQSQ
jgi:outer membrane lipoprotein-sorting protein